MSLLYPLLVNHIKNLGSLLDERVKQKKSHFPNPCLSHPLVYLFLVSTEYEVRVEEKLHFPNPSLSQLLVYLFLVSTACEMWLEQKSYIYIYF